MAQMILGCLHSRRQLLWLEENRHASFLFWHGFVWDLASEFLHFPGVSRLILLSLVALVGVV